MTDPTVADFQALARSSPWLWRTVALRWNPPNGPRVWLARPARCVIEWASGVERLDESPSDGRAVFGWDAGGAPVSAEQILTERGGFRFLSDVEPLRRSDGLVQSRPDDMMLSTPSQPMVDGYFSVATIDPTELADGVTVTDVRAEVLRGRTTWVGDCVPLDTYEPRCGCCELLPNARNFALEFDAVAEADRPPAPPFPTRVEIWLDRQTGIMTRWVPRGVDTQPREVEILEVDGDFESVWSSVSTRP